MRGGDPEIARPRCLLSASSFTLVVHLVEEQVEQKVKFFVVLGRLQPVVHSLVPLHDLECLCLVAGKLLIESHVQKLQFFVTQDGDLLFYNIRNLVVHIKNNLDKSIGKVERPISRHKNIVKTQVQSLGRWQKDVFNPGKSPRFLPVFVGERDSLPIRGEANVPLIDFSP
jgi:hypothetical protein